MIRFNPRLLLPAYLHQQQQPTRPNLEALCESTIAN